MKTHEPSIIVITGATRGLGRALTDGFIREGHTVLGCGRSERSIRQLQESHPPPHNFQVVDVASGARVKSWADDLLARHGPPDLLINNAGLVNDPAPLWRISEEEFGRVIDVNIKGIANVIRAFVPAMAARARGVIVNLSSGWGRSTDANVAPYCATKWAVEGLTQALAQELPAGMAAVALNPGIIHTDMLKRCFGADAANYPSPAQWVEKAVPFLLGLGPRNNGESLTVQ